MPFRQRPEDHLGPLAADRAVHDAVGQMVRQFADAHAFLRELVQNSLDADATAIDVLLDGREVDGRAVLEVSVRDDGRGMDRETVERSLLVLFRSTKEGDPSRIGKFGVGFFSVFAAGPDLVTVETGTSPDADGLRLLLRPDFTWELRRAAPRRGTSVRVRIPLGDNDLRALADRCVERLRVWCPHVRVPVTVRFEGVPGRDEALRIDAPHAIESPVQVREARDGAVAIVGLTRAPSRRYYNRGLLLQAEEGATAERHRGLAVLLDAPDLHHTISRDAVVRDAAFGRREERLRALARGPLRDLALRRWRDAAARCATARQAGAVDREAGATLAFLARVLPDGPLAPEPGELPWPLLEPAGDGDDARTTSLAPGIFRARPLHTATARGALTAALAARGERVLDLAPTGDADDDAALAAVLRALAPAAAPADRAFMVLRCAPALPLEAAERLLLDALRPLALAARLAGVTLADAEGSGADRLWYALPPGHEVLRGGALVALRADQPFAFKPGGVLALRRGHPDVARAVAAAGRDPRFAALVLLRLALLAAGRLDADGDRALLARHAGVTS